MKRQSHPEADTERERWEELQENLQWRWVKLLLSLLNLEMRNLPKAKASYHTLRAQAIEIVEAAQTAQDEVGNRLAGVQTQQDGWEEYLGSVQIRELNRLLDSAHLEAQANVMEGLGGLVVVYQPKFSSQRQGYADFAPVYGTITLIQQGRLDRLRKCKSQDCPNGAVVDGKNQAKWFIAQRADKQTCSAACRQKVHSRTPEFKTKRQQYLKTFNSGAYKVKSPQSKRGGLDG